ncbi:MAG: ferritin-like domain-containing protein [Bacteroidetes bacterium]|nr:ferritin-like domain-containing protein [Bacteroidota bacterium]
MENLRNSDYWLDYYQTNLQAERINWSQEPQITQEQKAAIIPSLRAWQLGETSEGHNLRAATAKYANRHNDPVYRDAIDLFIKEEQKHGENLGKYLDRIGVPRKKKDVGDSLFRKVRGFATNMEMWTITVLIIEHAAQVYYQAIKNATNCNLLSEICTDILIDEAHHIQFQRERLSIIFNRKPSWKREVAFFIYHLHFKLTYRAIWIGHSKALKEGGYHFGRFKRLMHYKFNLSMEFLQKGVKASLSPVYMRVW